MNKIIDANKVYRTSYFSMLINKFTIIILYLLFIEVYNLIECLFPGRQVFVGCYYNIS